MQICAACHFENDDERCFCKRCGAFLKIESFKNNSGIYSASEMKVQRIVSNLNQYPHERINWDATVDRYVEKAERFRALMQLEGLNDESANLVMKQLDKFIAECKNPEFQIAFVGTIKTGKSTLINALLGHNYASMAVTPETAALTKFRSSKQDYVKVTFYTKLEWSQLWRSMTSSADTFINEYKELNADAIKDQWIDHASIKKIGSEMKNACIEDELKIWSSSKQAEHYFVKEIEVGISALTGIPEQVVFVDTPGLCDPVSYRSEITKKYIKRANAVFVCMDAQKLAREELETISSVFSFTTRKEIVYLIATHWDTLNNPAKDWQQQKAFVVKQTSGPAFFGDEHLANRNIIHSSAFIYNLCRDINKLSPDDIMQLRIMAMKFGFDPINIEMHIGEIKAICNIDTIKEIINKKLVARYPDFLREKFTSEYNDIKHKLRNHAESINKNQKTLLEASAATTAEIAKKIEKTEKENAELNNNLKILYGVLKQVNDNTQKRLNKLLDKIN